MTILDSHIQLNRVKNSLLINYKINLGDHLAEIFKTTSQGTRTQADVSGGGKLWEAIVCWYLNLCLIGTRTVVIKHKKDLIPEPIKEAISVKYGNFISNTKADLIAITFPNKEEYLNK